MSRWKPVQDDGDEGSALVLTLVFMMVVGLFLSAALEKSQTVTRAGSALEERGRAQYALDSGIDRGLAFLPADLASPGPGGPLCPSPGPAVELPGSSYTSNGQLVRYFCETLRGSAITSTSLTSNYAVVLRGTTPDTFTTSGSNAAVSSDPCANPAPSGGYVRLGASLYLSGPQSNTSQPVILCNGHVAQFSAAPCTESSMAALTSFRPFTAGFFRGCTKQTPDQATPAVSIDGPPPPGDVSGCYVDVRVVDGSPVVHNSPCSSPPVVSPGGFACRLFFPGRYASPPSTVTGSTDSYFTSGSYLFQFAGGGTFTVNSSSRAVAGQRVNPDVGFDRPASTCANVDDDAAVMAATAAGLPDLGARIDTARGGVQWVFGGNSQLNVVGTLTLHSRRHVNPLEPGATFVARSDGYTYPQPPSSALSGSGCSSTFSLCNSSGNFVVNGRAVAPDAPVKLFTGGNQNVVTKGLVARSLHVTVPTSGAGNLAVDGPGGQDRTPPPSRVVRLRSHTPSTSEINEAIATVDNFTREVVVHSWRTGTCAAPCSTP